MSPSYKTVLKSRRLRRNSQQDLLEFKGWSTAVFLILVIIPVFLGAFAVYREFFGA
jgi:hypothetical protein